MIDRRRALRRIGSVSVAAGLAGCTGEENADGSDETVGSDRSSSDTDTATSSDTDTPEDTTSLEDEYPSAWAIDERLGIVVLSADAVVERAASEITGEVVNASDEGYDYVQLSFELLDDRDVKIADALANTNGLRAGQRWRYTAVGASDPDITTFRLTDVDAY